MLALAFWASGLPVSRLALPFQVIALIVRIVAAVIVSEIALQGIEILLGFVVVA